jgi:hypothetical protein
LQAFPFEGCPPITAAASTSPGLAHVLEAVREALPGMGTASRNSLMKVGPGRRAALLSAPLWLLKACVTMGQGQDQQPCVLGWQQIHAAGPRRRLTPARPQVVLNISDAFDASFQRWSVGLGIEAQLDELRACLGLPLRPCGKAAKLDYGLLVKPQVRSRVLVCKWCCGRWRAWGRLRC